LKATEENKKWNGLIIMCPFHISKGSDLFREMTHAACKYEEKGQFFGKEGR